MDGKLRNTCRHPSESTSTRSTKSGLGASGPPSGIPLDTWESRSSAALLSSSSLVLSLHCWSDTAARVLAADTHHEPRAVSISENRASEGTNISA